MSLATYSFLPWLRRGLANRITATDHDPTVTLRAAVRVDLEITGREFDGGTRTAPVERDLALYGPGDIVGIEPRAIVRSEPRGWITDFEPNYLAHVELYDEDLPWRYTPAAPDTARHRLRPWIALVVLAEEEFADGADIAGKPLPYVEVADAGVFPPADQLWAWAHVHVDRSLAGSDSEFVSTDMDAVLPRFTSVLASNPDLAHSRLLSPRKLAPNTAYHAFVMPTFESGRLAGLGLAPDGAPHATASAWGSYEGRQQGQRYPYYHRWFFRTGTTGDFESLVRLLQPRPVDPRVGTRPMDVQAPGANLPGITDPELGGVLRLGGALRIPRASLDPDEQGEADRYEHWDEPTPHPFQTALAQLINLADDYAAAPAADANAASGLGAEVEDDPDPLITPPLYGRWHALTSRLLVDRDGDPLLPDDNWVHELNLDPRHRVAAGFGTRVVQDNQEQYMHAAWEQIGDVLAANRRIRQAQLAREVSAVWQHRHLEPLVAADAGRALGIIAPVSGRVRVGDATVRHRLRSSHLQPTLLSTALRRTVRPRGRLLRALPFDDAVRPDNLLARAGAGQVSAAPPKVTPPGVVTTDDVADDLHPDDAPGWALDLLRRLLRLVDRLRAAPVAVLVLLVVLLLVLAAPLAWLLLPLLVVAVVVWRLPAVTRWRDAVRAADLARSDSRTPEAVDDLPTSSDFRVTPFGSDGRPRPGGPDSVEAVRFKQALRDSYTVVVASGVVGAVPPKATVDPAAVASDMVAALAPEMRIPRRVLAGIFVPPRILAELDETFVEAMAYPEFDIPMYKPLVDASTDLFVPNLNLIEQNSITLLETNQPFIESYMVGLNHELARELLWREYPTDQRGSYFRQFWDVKGYLDDEGLDAEARREKLRDIPPLHLWSRFSHLGDHDHREAEGAVEEEVVLVIRGELLKRYPNAVIYAHRACWQRTGADGTTHPCLAEGEIDNRQERRLEPLTAAEEGSPPRSKVRSPLYEAKVDPDITFFGFDLTVEEAMGGTGADPDDDPGWFFVIEERPGDTRFGLDIEQQPQLHTWNDLSWEDVQPGPPGSHIEITAATPTLSLVLPTDPQDAELVPQHEEDKHVSWSRDASAADLAYVLLQVPVRVAVHASEMLTRR